MPTDSETSAWIALFRAQRAARATVDAELKAAAMPPLEWYDILLEVGRAGAEGLRPNALEDLLLLPQHGVSRLVARLSAAGLLERLPCPEDRRGFRLRLTPAGTGLRAEIWHHYGAAIAARMGPLAEEELQTLAKLLNRITPR